MIGEHIRTRRDGRWSHAIDCGDETVIHLSVDADGAPRVRRSYRPAFVAGAEATETVTHRERTFPPGEVVARAYSRFSDPALAAMFRDSEAFAAWCATGRLPAGPPNLALPSLFAIPAQAPLGSIPAAPRRSARAASASARPAKPGRARRPAEAAKAAAKERATARAGAKAKAKRPAAKARRKTKPAAARRAKPRRGRRR